MRCTDWFHIIVNVAYELAVRVKNVYCTVASFSNIECVPTSIYYFYFYNIEITSSVYF